jgi:hypothetical protein
MKKAVLLTSSLLFAATMAIAQDTPAAGSQDPSQSSTNTTTQTQTSQGSMLRGCLSGSADNYTLTDLNGIQYKLMGGDSSLQNAVGHEVEVSGTQSQSAETSSGNGETMAHAANSFQVSQLKDTGSACKMNSRPNGVSPDDHPMDEKAPKGSTTTTDQPQPRLMALAQQTSAPMSSTGTDASQANQSTSPTAPTSGPAGAQTTPPVTSQTPTTSASPTNPGTQSGASPANNTGMSPAEANSNAQAARQGETSTNPNTGQTTGQGVTGSAAPSTNPNAVPASPNSTTPQNTGTNPQANTSQPPSTDDSNKPLYERQATDIPWAHHDSNTTAPSTTTPNTPH